MLRFLILSGLILLDPGPGVYAADDNSNNTVATKESTVDAALKSGNYFQARKRLRTTLQQARPKDRPSRLEWTRALHALMSLERMVGEEAEALRLFSLCDSVCAELIVAEEWQAIRRWGCQRNPQAKICKK